MTRVLRPVFVVAIAVAALGAPASASDPLAVYCMIEKVVLEPAECPDRAQVWGACLPSNVRAASASRGFFYYKPRQGQEDVTRREWADLKSVAGKQVVVGFGRVGYPYGTFRAGDAKVESPDEYPIHIGVVQRVVSPNFFGLLSAALKAR